MSPTSLNYDHLPLSMTENINLKDFTCKLVKQRIEKLIILKWIVAPVCIFLFCGAVAVLASETMKTSVQVKNGV